MGRAWCCHLPRRQLLSARRPRRRHRAPGSGRYRRNHQIPQTRDASDVGESREQFTMITDSTLRVRGGSPWTSRLPKRPTPRAWATDHQSQHQSRWPRSDAYARRKPAAASSSQTLSLTLQRPTSGSHPAAIFID